MRVAEDEGAVEVGNTEEKQTVVASAIKKAKAKNARLRLMKERNENYLAERRGEDEADDELTQELRVSTSE
jgi:hypothetical protein